MLLEGRSGSCVVCGVGECGFGHLIVVICVVHKCGFVLVVSMERLRC